MTMVMITGEMFMQDQSADWYKLQKRHSIYIVLRYEHKVPGLGLRLVQNVRRLVINYVLPFNRRCRIYSGFHFLLAHKVPPFKHVEKNMTSISNI